MVIQEIKSIYVDDDCIQVMIPHIRDTFVLLDDNGVMYANSKNTHENLYLKDERRHNFPYSDIPTHQDILYGVRVTFVNQLLGFEKPYITIGINDGINEMYVKKDGKLALLITNQIEPKIIDKQSHLTLKTAQKLREQLVSELYPCVNQPSNTANNTDPLYHEYDLSNNKHHSHSYTFFTTINNGKITNLNGVHIMYYKESKYNLCLVNYPLIDYSSYALELLKKGAEQTREPNFEWDDIYQYSSHESFEIPEEKVKTLDVNRDI